MNESIINDDKINDDKINNDKINDDKINDNKINDDKKIKIIGTNNRYQIKKMIEERKPRKRIVCENWNIKPEFFEHENQIIVLNNIFNEKDPTETTQIIKREIETKINNYKKQDIERKIWNPELFVNFKQILEMLFISKMKCYYCNSKVFILYEMVREESQWTLDRINNELGHNHGNLLISCLKCNLKRRNQNSKAFLFTKNMKIIKNDTIHLDSDL